MSEIDILRKNVFDNLQIIEEKDKEIERLNNIIDKATSYYYKTLNQYNNENKPMSEVAVTMFNILENNK